MVGTCIRSNSFFQSNIHDNATATAVQGLLIMLRHLEKSQLQNPGPLRLGPFSVSRGILSIVFGCSVAIVLTAGLWPFHAPRNEVRWLQGENGIGLGTYATAISVSPLVPSAGASSGCTLEIWVKPARLWMTRTILTFYRAQTHQGFTVEQDYTDLVLRLTDKRNSPSGDTSLRLEDVFRNPEFFLTVTSDAMSTRIYVNGKLKLTSDRFPITARNLSGQVILGNSPLRNHSWNGQIKGLAVYGSALNADQVSRHATQWLQGSLQQLEASDHVVALYPFAEHSGSLIHSTVAPAVNLEIPETFEVIDQLRFESPESEAHAAGNYAKNALLNVLGFVPLGFVAMIFFLRVCKANWPLIAATLTGAAVSLTIEYVQSFLPTRFSGVTDLFTNTFGAWIGAASYVIVVRPAGKRIRVKSSRTQPE
jgi:VanZ family protein